MPAVKEKFINGIQNVDNEELLQEVYNLIQNIQETREVFILNEEQKLLIEQARKDYSYNQYYTTEVTFKDLLAD